MVCQRTGLLAGDGWEPLPGTGLSFPWLVGCDPQHNQQEPTIIEDRRFSPAVHKLEGSELYYQRGARSWKEGGVWGYRGPVGEHGLGSGEREGLVGSGLPGGGEEWKCRDHQRQLWPVIWSHPTSTSHLVLVLWELAFELMAKTKANCDLVRGRGIASQQSCDTCPNLSPKWTVKFPSTSAPWWHSSREKGQGDCGEDVVRPSAPWAEVGEGVIGVDRPQEAAQHQAGRLRHGQDHRHWWETIFNVKSLFRRQRRKSMWEISPSKE